MSKNEKKVKCEFLGRSHTISLNKGLWTHLCICVNASVRMLQRTHERVNCLCVLHSLHGLPRQRC